jgi:CheY-like chemotaxis protein
MMPKMDGLELYNQLKNVDPNINGCFLTASSETYGEELSKKKGRNCELNKDLFLYMPLPISKIVEEINRRIFVPLHHYSQPFPFTRKYVLR